MPNRVQEGMVMSYTSHDHGDYIISFWPTSACKGDYSLNMEIGSRGRIDILVIESPHKWLSWKNLYDIARHKLRAIWKR